MAAYVSSNKNRFYASVETTYGQAQIVSAADRFPATHVEITQNTETLKRIDKTGTRTFQGTPSTGRTRTAFEVRSYLSVWNGAGEPAYGSLFQAACGATPCLSNGCVVNTLVNATELVSSAPHGFRVGSAISWSNEIRFVTSVLNAYTFTFNAPFTNSPSPGVLLGPTVTYRLATDLPSFTLYDYWDSQSPISRLLCGCAVNAMDLTVNGDYHDFHFSGPACELADAMSFSNGTAGLSAFPSEPAISDFNGSGVPGHLGQVWIGTPSAQFLTLTGARIQLRNNLDLRRNEFGLVRPAAIVPGERVVKSAFSLLVLEDNQTADLFRAAKQREPFAAMLQLGTQQGQLMGIYLPQMIAEVPQYKDTEPRLVWDFQNNIAQGVSDDELFIAFA